MGIKLIVVGSILNIQFKDYLDFEGEYFNKNYITLDQYCSINFLIF
jgi:hypothetical protein